MILRTRLNPLEWTPLEAIPTNTSPVRTFEPSINCDFSTAPTVNPAISYSPSAYMPGISAVSPPTKAQPALSTTLGDAGNDGFDFLRFVAADGHVIEKFERLGALRQDIIDAHRHSVDTDRIVLIHSESQFQFGADTVGAAHQNRFLEMQG